MSPRTRRQSGEAVASSRALLESMEDVSKAKQQKKWNHDGRRKARMQKRKALAISTRRDLRLNSPSGSDPVDVEDPEGPPSQSLDSSDEMEEEPYQKNGTEGARTFNRLNTR